MTLVVLLRGVNVGGHRRFRPTLLAEQLKHLDIVSIGAAGTFVIRRRITRMRLREEFACALPFDAGVVICDGREVLRLVSRNPFAGERVSGDDVCFVSVLATRPRLVPPTPLSMPSSGRWLVKILGRDDRFVFGIYRRRMKVIGYLGSLDRLFGAPATTRSWSTITAIARTLGDTAS